jgi:PadR family transcriptional regulator PadR
VPRSRALSPQALRVLLALAEEPARWRYGYELGAQVDLRSGSLYPILMRLADRGLLESAWQSTVPGKPPRHVYRLTATGVSEVARLPSAASRGRAAMARRQLGRAT